MAQHRSECHQCHPPLGVALGTTAALTPRASFDNPTIVCEPLPPILAFAVRLKLLEWSLDPRPILGPRTVHMAKTAGQRSSRRERGAVSVASRRDTASSWSSGRASPAGARDVTLTGWSGRKRAGPGRLEESPCPPRRFRAAHAGRRARLGPDHGPCKPRRRAALSRGAEAARADDPLAALRLRVIDSRFTTGT